MTQKKNGNKCGFVWQAVIRKIGALGAFPLVSSLDWSGGGGVKGALLEE
jgi:hypothetical protein